MWRAVAHDVQLCAVKIITINGTQPPGLLLNGLWSDNGFDTVVRKPLGMTDSHLHPLHRQPE